MNYENNSNIKPLDEYLKDIKSRNIKLSKILPGLDKTIENVSSYDELYKKLIEEPYYLANELINKKNNLSRNSISDQQVQRVLIFNSTDNMKKNNEEKSISPINQDKTIFFSNVKNTLAPNNDDIMNLINNCKNIEKVIEKKKNQTDLIETRIQNNLNKIKEFENLQLEFVEQKHEINDKLKDIKSLVRQYDEKLERLNEVVNSRIQRDRDNLGNTINNITTRPDEVTRRDENIQINDETRSKLYDYINIDNPGRYDKSMSNLSMEPKLEEAVMYWKNKNYDKIEGLSLEKSYDLICQVLRDKDKEIDRLKKEFKNYEKIKNENQQKNIDIIHLLAEIETLKIKLQDYDAAMVHSKMVEDKIDKIMNENCVLYKENSRLRLRLEEGKFLKSKL